MNPNRLHNVYNLTGLLSYLVSPCRSRGESERGRGERRREPEQFDPKIHRAAEGSFFNPGLESMPVWNWDTTLAATAIFTKIIIRACIILDLGYSECC